jgi:TonB family protein
MRVSLVSTLLACVALAATVRANEGTSTIPVPLETPLPEYPAGLLKSGVEGTVVSHLWVTEEGSVSAAIVTDSPDKRFNAPTLASLRSWKFEPATRNGEAVARVCSVPIEFVRKSVTVGAIVLPEPFNSEPQIVTRVPADYPLSLIRAAFTGKVIMHLFIDEEGRAKEVGVAESTDPRLDRAAVDAVRKWRFAPATVNGKPVTSWTMATIGLGLSEAEMSTVWPRPKTIVRVVYPYEHAVAGKKGSAAVRALIGTEGIVLKTTIQESSEPEFVFAFMAAMDATLYEPAKRDGKPVEWTITRRHEFKPGGKTSAIERETDELVERIRGGRFSPASVRELDAPPAPESMVSPIYPTSLQFRNLAGNAKIEVIIDKQGRAVLPRIVEASEPEFGWAAATAAQRWLFNPPTVKGKPVEVKVVIPFKFVPPEENTETAES